MEARAYTLNELDSHLSNSRQESPSLVPLSPLRLNSFLHNPRAESDDTVLIEMREKGRLIAYRTLLPDLFYAAGGQSFRFAWLSGNYVDPEYRRKGISTRLLHLAEARWEGRLMYTNYAPASKAVYDRTGQFQMVARREGTRFYLRSAMADLLQARVGPLPLLAFGDRLVNSIREGRVKRAAPAPSETCIIRRMVEIGPDLVDLIRNPGEVNLFRRDSKVFRWILDHPWITTEKADPVPYHFSYRAERFENLLYRFDLAEGKGSGLLWLLVHNRKLSAPYLFFNDPRILPCITGQFIRTMVESESAYATIRHPPLCDALRSADIPFLTRRRMPQLVFAHQKLLPVLPDHFTLQDGDGDMVFTG